MEVYIDFEGKSMVFRLIGELDEHSAEFVRRRLDASISENSFDAVIFDLSRLSFMDSTGIGVVIGRYKLIRKLNKPVCVRNPSPTVDKIFKMSGLYEIISKI
ncbi:MAG: anti-sigma factor antagonist [Clostridiales bacterium]|nr:anti-sigma factor antagonist [Clostridiales bacterium]